MLARGGHQSARRAADVSAGVLEQLPNTVSVSFKGTKSHEIIALLREKVTNTSKQGRVRNILSFFLFIYGTTTTLLPLLLPLLLLLLLSLLLLLLLLPLPY